ncbi:aminoacyl-tRNA hydrolase [Clostridium botulinum]|uniref:Peptidyl-tRNA hydrolase n=2 Tax=Clostridium botulinum TaxID=1491 RepID=PTH_CLOBM|nr:aminoacyl-tRNA hydrolase [Clostridium botulinum]B1KTE2.1 RecName: Full=Peptidyl-tRNA hydrolase; Short=PTH [Clostridium botulinum A3 str. Loch Maree]ACA54471.1 aminoacyl-tRNA hydrolase [Clostridium botulinum A3 str. Loch Maree]NFH65881.1 aminoacyl-tRNA hydrolase [Clostridium botulinum]NFJ10176.1 aminoacyl-tRNA hydrolase [Clostridium botulinum]NFK16462.1 aminoacyl-tRNA hydrolase [Clostridium botulinum]NFM94371.1 aminoacyl-tRNA hydrolase [Clostridium botulinum]
MYLVVGLGNIGKEYKKTRHNIGFDVVDIVAEKYNIEINRQKFKGSYGEGRIGNEKIILLKPSTYMNLSGESVIEAANFYKIDKENIIVIYDDMSIDIGKLRVRGKGSAGGHNGIKNIIQHLNSDIFPRVRVGIGQPDENVVNYVLGKFSKDQREVIEKVLAMSAKACISIVEDGVTEAMNKYNGVKIEV